MIEFTLAEDSLPFNYLEELDISMDRLAIRCINEKFPHLNLEECENIFEEHIDIISDKLYELKDSNAINNYCVGEEEIDESSGTWGYYHFEIDDIEKARDELEREVMNLLEEVVAEIEL